MDFMSQVKSVLDDEKQLTENGAVGYKTTGTKLLDINFKISSMRNMNEKEICDLFSDAYFENKLLALKWLFYLRDVRGGQGERKSFRIIFNWLINTNLAVATALLNLIPEYGRWDDLVNLIETPLKDMTITIIREQLRTDLKNMKNNEPVSLLAKWLPSADATSLIKRKSASILRNSLNLTKKKYKLSISSLRKYLDVVEIKMSNKEWNKINYSKVPSRANLLYNNAFLRNDEDRRRQFLNSLSKGEQKINAGVLYPHDIVHKYNGNYGNVDETLEELWKALPNLVDGNSKTLCVTDGSGSMCSRVGNTSVSCLEVANALTIYFSEHCSGVYRNKYITFSSRPQFVDFTNASNLKEKLRITSRYNEVADTNIEAVFDLILKTAIDNNLTQNDIPSNILMLSDMEFNRCAASNCGRGVSNTLFNEISLKYSQYGYKLPRLIFWNIYSRTSTIPVKNNELGVALVSGFSVNTVKMVLSGELDPFKCLLEQLENDRYKPIEEIFNLIKQ